MVITKNVKMEVLAYPASVKEGYKSLEKPSGFPRQLTSNVNLLLLQQCTRCFKI